jgi:hypothetical protein
MRRKASGGSHDSPIDEVDVPFQNTTSFVWDTPVGRGRRFGTNMPGLANAIVGG